MIVSMWMSRDVVTIGPNAPVTEAAGLMSQRHIRRLPVVERRTSGGVQLVGMISATDVLHAFPPNINPFAVIPPDLDTHVTAVSQIMRKQLVVATPDMPIEEAATIMRDQKIGALPVLREGRLIGLITESDIFRALVDLFTVPGRGARITFDMTKGEDVFSLIGPLAQKHRVRVISIISAHEHEQPVCVLRVAGEQVEAMLDDIWASGHLVKNVLRFPLS